MRIRKHAKISPLVYAGSGTVIQTHVCQLNQSPWDVMTFPQSSISDPATPPPPPPYQVDKDDSYMANGTFADYIGADKSAGSVKFGVDDEKEKWDDDIGFDNCGGAEDEKGEEHLMSLLKKNGDEMLCCKTDGKGWQCRKKAKGGHSLCEHHTTQLKSYGNSNNHLGNSVNNVNKKSERSSESRRRVRPKKPAAAAAPSSNPYEFYYYSGFGPRWGKKRGPTATTATAEPYASANANASDPCENNFLKVDEPPNTPEPNAASPSSQIDNEGFVESFDYVEYEEEDDDDDNGETGKKRTRKPIKARSLKSLM